VWIKWYRIWVTVLIKKKTFCPILPFFLIEQWRHWYIVIYMWKDTLCHVYGPRFRLCGTFVGHKLIIIKNKLFGFSLIVSEFLTHHVGCVWVYALWGAFLPAYFANHNLWAHPLHRPIFSPPHIFPVYTLKEYCLRFPPNGWMVQSTHVYLHSHFCMNISPLGWVKLGIHV
jgi:hypothetical protein